MLQRGGFVGTAKTMDSPARQCKIYLCYYMQPIVLPLYQRKGLRYTDATRCSQVIRCPTEKFTWEPQCSLKPSAYLFATVCVCVSETNSTSTLSDTFVPGNLVPTLKLDVQSSASVRCESLHSLLTFVLCCISSASRERRHLVARRELRKVFYCSDYLNHCRIDKNGFVEDRELLLQVTSSPHQRISV